MYKLLFVAFFLLFVQGLLSYRQTMSYRNQVIECSRLGKVGVGTARGGLKAGVITIIACDSTGVIVEARKLKGFTVFAKFRRFGRLVGQNVNSLREEIENETNKESKSLLKAIEQVEMSLQ